MTWNRGKQPTKRAGAAAPAREYQAEEVDALINRSGELLDELHDVMREMSARLHRFIGEDDDS